MYQLKWILLSIKVWFDVNINAYDNFLKCFLILNQWLNEWIDSLLPRHWGEFAILLLCADPTETAAESHLSLPPTIIVIKTSENNNKK